MVSHRMKRPICLSIGAVMIAVLVLSLVMDSHPADASTASASPLRVTWMNSFASPGTPAKDNKVGVIKVGPSSAKNILVLEPGTSAGATYFVPLAKWIVSKVTGWQVWSVERRENLLEDQSELNLYKNHKVTTTQLYDYYLGYLKNPSITHHFQLIPNSSVTFASQWGMNVAVQDLHVVITAAKKLGGRVVLGGHSLGGSVVTAYATWNFGGRAGAVDLSGLVYIDGASSPVPITAQAATQDLQALDNAGSSPWLSFGGITAPYSGLFQATGSASAYQDPNATSLGQTSGLLPSTIVPPVPVTNLGQFGYALNVATSPPSLIAAQAHLGQGIATAGPVHGWNGRGALTPIRRFATMFSGEGIHNADGTEWYFPQRLTDDTGAVANGNANPAQSVLDVHATMGHALPKTLLMYAFGARLGGQAVLNSTMALAQQSGISMKNLTLVNRQSTYAHNEPCRSVSEQRIPFEGLTPLLEEGCPRHLTKY